MERSPALSYAQSNQTRFVDELREFVRFPSISSQDEYRAAIDDCAAWLAAHLKKIGFRQTRIVPTRGHPIVFAEWIRSPELPTVLIYGHYDVQPPEPLNEWRSPPFEPIVRDDYLYGRGASDDKGQMLALIKSIEAFAKTAGAPPVNVKCVFEGEEEIGSPNFADFLDDHVDALQADVAMVSDMPILARNRPAITYALRGALAMEMEISRTGQDLHSGNFGGAICNPVQALCEMIATFHDADGRVRIPGFYDRVRRPETVERQYLTRAGPTDDHFLENARTRAGCGKRGGYSLYERTVLRPALSITGITGGYQGKGAKSIIPSRASAKLDFRLVPEQDPETIAAQFRRHILRRTPPMFASSVRTQFMAKPVVVDLNNQFTQAAISAYQKSFHARPVFIRSGGTIPPVSAIHERLDIPVMMLGFGLPDDNIHSPNERFYLPNFFKGIATGIRFLDEIAEQSKSQRRFGDGSYAQTGRYAGAF